MTEYLPRDIRQIKLCNGEEILTEVVGEDRTEILIKNPLRVHRQRVAVGDVAREANMFSRWMGFADNDEYMIQKKDILVEAIVNDVVALYYNKMMENVNQDHESPIMHSSEAADPDIVKSPTVYVDEEDDEPTYH